MSHPLQLQAQQPDLEQAEPPPPSPKKTGTLITLLIGFAVLISPLAYFWIHVEYSLWSLKRSEPYLVSLEHAKRHPRVIADTGLPIKAGSWPVGDVVTSGRSGAADITIELSGPRGAGKAIVVTELRRGRWEITRSSWEVVGRRPVNLLAAAPTTEPPDSHSPPRETSPSQPSLSQ